MACWLQVSATKGLAELATHGHSHPGPGLGYHLQDVNLALGNLVADVGKEEAGDR